MINLPTTSDKLRLITSAAGTIQAHVSFVDAPNGITSSSTITPDDQDPADITTATTTDICAVPGASTVRNVKHISVRNTHASIANTVTVEKYNGSTSRMLFRCALQPNEGLVFADGVWFVYDALGGVKSGTTQAAAVTTKALSADQSNSTTTPTEVTGLSLEVGPGTYVFSYHVRYRAAATTTGVKFDVNHSGTVTSFIWLQRWSDVSAVASTAVPDQDNIGAAGHVMGSFASRAKGTAGRGVTLSVDTADADMLMLIEGHMVVTVSGELELWHGSEVAAASTVMAQSSLILTKIG